MLSIPELAQATRGKSHGTLVQKLTGVSTDTRSLQPGVLFFALRGKNFDGHKFLNEAFQKGAGAAVIDEQFFTSQSSHVLNEAKKHSFIVVQNVYQALLDSAHAYRQKFQIPVIGVTGSAGKTTTKECIRAILSLRYPTLSNVGNFNNHIGVPLSLFQLSDETKAAVFELAANKAGDIHELSEVVAPKSGVITCIQPVHLEGFGSLENIYNTKLELGEYISENQGTLTIFGDDPELVKRAKKTKASIRTFGRSRQCDFRISDERQDGEWIRFTLNDRYYFSVKAIGILNVMNFAAGIAATETVGFDLAYLAEHWHSYIPVSNRFEIDPIEHPRVVLVKDFYNSNPVSFALALKSFEALPAQGRRVVVAGDMLELGDSAAHYHAGLGELIAKSRANALIYIGKFSEMVANSTRKHNQQIQIATFSDNQHAAEYLLGFLRDRDHVFLKASRGMKFEEIVGVLKSPAIAPLIR